MFHLTLADAILLAIILVVIPSYSYVTGRRIARGALPPRKRSYARMIVTWWLIVAATAFVWHRLGRPFPAMGLRLALDAPAVAGAIFCVLMLAYVNGQWRVLARMPGERRARLRNSLGPAAAIMPRTRSEYIWFLGVSLTAGICEEVLYRGYFFAMFAPRITLWGAVVASALIFGLGHLYQGARGIAKTAIAGMVLGAVYAITGSLLWPAILHVLIDVSGGTIGYRLLRDSESSARA